MYVSMLNGTMTEVYVGGEFGRVLGQKHHIIIIVQKVPKNERKMMFVRAEKMFGPMPIVASQMMVWPISSSQTLWPSG